MNKNKRVTINIKMQFTSMNPGSSNYGSSEAFFFGRVIAPYGIKKTKAEGIINRIWKESNSDDIKFWNNISKEHFDVVDTENEFVIVLQDSNG